jgi:hypothetical protein
MLAPASDGFVALPSLMPKVGKVLVSYHPADYHDGHRYQPNQSATDTGP